MHELSIVLSIVDIAQAEARKQMADQVESVELDIGMLSGIDFSAFEFAWKYGRKKTLLEHAKCQINKIPGKGYCPNCTAAFEVSDLYSGCPVCQNYFIEIQEGKEMSVKRLTLLTT